MQWENAYKSLLGCMIGTVSSLDLYFVREQLKILYTDKINTRRTIEKIITFEPDNFRTEKASQPFYIYLIWIIVIAAVIYFFYRRHKKKQRLRQEHRK